MSEWVEQLSDPNPDPNLLFFKKLFQHFGVAFERHVGKLHLRLLLPQEAVIVH